MDVRDGNREEELERKNEEQDYQQQRRVEDDGQDVLQAVATEKGVG